jgi:hypothetical protein
MQKGESDGKKINCNKATGTKGALSLDCALVYKRKIWVDERDREDERQINKDKTAFLIIIITIALRRKEGK